MERKHILITLGVVIVLFAAAAMFAPEVARSWQPPRVLAKFKSLLAGANRVEVAEPSAVNGRQKIYFTESNPATVAELIDSVDFSRFGGGTVCACSGNAVLKFYRNNELLLEASSQHKEYLRWQGWFADTRLTEQSSASLVGWIKERATAEQLKSIWPEDYR